MQRFLLLTPRCDHSQYKLKPCFHLHMDAQVLVYTAGLLLTLVYLFAGLGGVVW